MNETRTGVADTCHVISDDEEHAVSTSGRSTAHNADVSRNSHLLGGDNLPMLDNNDVMDEFDSLIKSSEFFDFSSVDPSSTMASNQPAQPLLCSDPDEGIKQAMEESLKSEVSIWNMYVGCTSSLIV